METIGTRFGGIPQSLPAPHLPTLSMDKVSAVLPSAFSFALLGGIESLLSAVVADSMTGRRHRSNAELVAQGAANIASSLFGGILRHGHHCPNSHKCSRWSEKSCRRDASFRFPTGFHAHGGSAG